MVEPQKQLATANDFESPVTWNAYLMCAFAPSEASGFITTVESDGATALTYELTPVPHCIHPLWWHVLW